MSTEPTLELGRQVSGLGLVPPLGFARLLPTSVRLSASGPLGLVAAAVISLASGAALVGQSPEDEAEADAHGYDTLRIEQEDKLFVPEHLVEEVWGFLRERFVEDKDYIRSINPQFTVTWSEELFHDTYFDTPTMQLHGMKSGVRRRHRINLSNPDDRKSGRQLMQIKWNDISNNDLERGEIKFDVEPTLGYGTGAENRHPILALVKAEHRDAFMKRLQERGIDHRTMRPILTIRDLRRRIYWSVDGKSFMSISHDQASTGIWWGRTRFCEIEPELNEIAFTEADAQTRAKMETVLHQVVGEILRKFPEIHRDLTPKYNKSFDRLEEQVPFLRLLVRTGMTSDEDMYVSLGLAALGLGSLGWLLVRRRRARSRFASNPPGSRPHPTSN